MRALVRGLQLATALLMGSCEAQQVRAPVNVSVALYEGCIQAQISTDIMIYGGWPVEDVRSYVQEVDTNCMVWTVVWYSALVTPPNPPVLQGDQYERFSARRQRILQEFALLVAHGPR